MLALRLQRTGRKHEPTFRVVLTDSKNGPKSGKYLENLGWYDTRRKNTLEQLDLARIKHWMSHGAKPSVTLYNFLVGAKAIEGKKLNALPRKSPVKKEGEAPAAGGPATAPDTASAPAPAAPAPAPAPAQEPKAEEKPAQ